MTLYAESSAVLRWLLNEPDADGVVDALRRAGRVLTSELTLLECRRALHRLVTAGSLPASAADRRRSDLERAAAGWDLWPVDSTVMALAGEPWPREPVRSLDAVHLATARLARGVVPDLRVLSADQRVRDNARALGLPVVPE